MKVKIYYYFQSYNNQHWVNYLFYYDASAPIKIGVMYGMVPGVLISLGTDKHLKYLELMGDKKVN